jgi:hypothetical protein
MKRIKEQAEVIIRLDYQEQVAHICVSAWPKMAGKIEKLYGPGKDHDTEDCARRWAVPMSAISFRRTQRAVKPKRVVTPEQVAAMQAGRLAARKVAA